MLLEAYRLLSDEWKRYVEYAVKMTTMVVMGVCLFFLFASLLLLSVEVAPPLPDEADAVRVEMRHAWQQYRKHSWGANELAPETLSPSRVADPKVGSQSGLTIVESLATLHLMGMSREFQQAEAWISGSFNFTNVSSSLNSAETSARVLGGLLSAFSFTEKPVFLLKALQVAEGLLAAFDTPSGLPAPLVVPFKGPVITDFDRSVRLDQMVGMYLEFSFLNRLIGLPKYATVVEKIMATIMRHKRTEANETNELWTPPNAWDIWSGKPLWSSDNGTAHSPSPSAVSLSSNLALAEVAIKAHLLVEDREALYVFRALMRGRLQLNAWLGCHTLRGKAACRFNLTNCRLVETLLLSLGQSMDPIAQRDLAHRLGDLCGDAMQVNSIHLSPEALLLKPTRSGVLIAKEADAHYAARPEPVLAGLLMWSRRRRTRHQQLLSNALRSMSQYLKGPSGYQGFTRTPDQLKPDNRQPSYLLAQTFKYIYMAFEPTRLNLVNGDWIFNTAGHLLPVRNGYQFGRLRNVVQANWGKVQQLMSDMERLRIARRRGQIQTTTAGTVVPSWSPMVITLGLLLTIAAARQLV